MVRNGEEAIAYIKGAGLYANRTEYSLPDLVLRDLKLHLVYCPRVPKAEILDPGLDADLSRRHGKGNYIDRLA